MCNFTKYQEFKKKYLTIKNQFVVAVLAELFGTYLLVTFVNVAIAGGIFGGGPHNLFYISFAIGIGVAVAIYITESASGAHLNPAVTLALFTIGKAPPKTLLCYTLVQYVGGFLGAAQTWLLYNDMVRHEYKILVSPPATNATAGIFATYPHKDVSVPVWLADQLWSTGVLIVAILAMVDPNNANVHRSIRPLLIGLTVCCLVMCTGPIAGTSLNPARDLPPRLLALIVGYKDAFSHSKYGWFMVPVIGPYVGAILGAFIYEILFEFPLEHQTRNEDIPAKATITDTTNKGFSETKTNDTSEKNKLEHQGYNIDKNQNKTNLP